MATGDPSDLQRFVDAQASTYDQALAELHAGAKSSHWMWFIFPQLAGLGRSPSAQYYGVSSLEEAHAYLNHPVLGPRLKECVEALQPWAGRRSPEQILGAVDAAKLRSSLTLFEAASADPLFGLALNRFYDGQRDQASLDLLGS